MIYSIQLLRFFAASLVVLNHSLGELNILPFGAIGVDIFFIISGFIISFITEKNSDHFLKKRFFRIAPMYWLFTFFIIFISIYLPDILRSSNYDLTHTFFSLFFIPYWTDTTAFSPILKLGWTLNFEMFFYLIFYFCMRLNYKNREILSSILLLIIYFTLAAFLLSDTSPFSFYADTIIFEFIFGMLLAVVYKNKSSLFNSYGSKVSLFLVCSSLIFLISTHYFSFSGGYRYIFWGMPALLCVVAFLSCEKYMKNENFKKFAVIGGDISYPLYLIHIYIIAFMNRVLFESINIYFLFFFGLLISCLVSYFVLVIFDNPIRRKLNSIFLK
tara:strand:+ start:99 stop:1085 length:987 start_codon:yes stop_codon:yes gene_type:complete